MNKPVLIFLSWMSFVSLGWSQDIHYTQFNLAPMTVNPAYTGRFLGTFRAGGIYRDQWASVTRNQFTTPSVYLDIPLTKGLEENDWIGVGAYIYQDKAGDLEFSQGALLLSAAYHRALDRNATRYLSFGVQAGMAQRRLALNDQAVTENMLIGGPPEEIPGDEKRFLDVHAGLIYSGPVEGSGLLRLGAAVHHITSPEHGLLQENEKKDLKFTLHGSLDHTLSNGLLLTPQALVQVAGNAWEASLQALVGFQIKPEDNFNIYVGGGYRVLDAFHLIVQADYKDFRAGFGYDVNVSRLTTASSTFGAIEFGISYIAKLYKKPEVDPVIFCPRF
jgi:type IX secretion system PorP/SprF family membrane protein